MAEDGVAGLDGLHVGRRTLPCPSDGFSSVRPAAPWKAIGGSPLVRFAKRGYEVDNQAVFELTFLEIHEKLTQRIRSGVTPSSAGSALLTAPSRRTARPINCGDCIPSGSISLLANSTGRPTCCWPTRRRHSTPTHASRRATNTRAPSTNTASRSSVIVTGHRLPARATSVPNWPRLLHFPRELRRPVHKPCNLPMATIGTLFKGREPFVDDLHARLRAHLTAGQSPFVNRLVVHGLGGAGQDAGHGLLRWHDLRLMQYPAGVAITWEPTLAQLTEPERRLLEALVWLSPSRSLCFWSKPRRFMEVIADPR